MHGPKKMLHDTVLANMLLSLGCPVELKPKLLGYVDGHLVDALYLRSVNVVLVPYLP